MTLRFLFLLCLWSGLAFAQVPLGDNQDSSDPDPAAAGTPDASNETVSSNQIEPVSQNDGLDNSLSPIEEPNQPLMRARELVQDALVLIDQGPFGAPPSTGLLVAPDRVITSAMLLEVGTFVNVTIPGKNRVRGAVVAADFGLGLALIRLEEAGPTHLRVQTSDQAIAGVIGFDVSAGYGSSGVLSAQPIEIDFVAPQYGRIQRLLPSSFEGAVVVAEDGTIVGIVVGPTQPGAPLVRWADSVALVLEMPETKPEIQGESVPGTKQSPLSWSLSGVFGIAIPHRPPSQITGGLQLELIIRQRLSIGAMATWTRRWTDQPSRQPESLTLVPVPYAKAFILGLVEPIFGDPEILGIGINIGAGWLHTSERIPHVYARFPTTCNPNTTSCELTELAVELEPVVFDEFAISIGLNLLRWNRGLLASTGGIRVGYLFVISTADLRGLGSPSPGPGTSTHLIKVQFHL